MFRSLFSASGEHGASEPPCSSSAPPVKLLVIQADDYDWPAMLKGATLQDHHRTLCNSTTVRIVSKLNGLLFAGVPCMNSLESILLFCERPAVQGALHRLQRAGADFPVVPQHFCSSSKSLMYGYTFPAVVKVGSAHAGCGKMKIHEPGLRIQKIGSNYRAFKRIGISGDWKTNTCTSIMDEIECTERYRRWADAAATFFGGLDILTVDAIIEAETGKEFILECFLCRILDRLVLDPSSPKRMAFEVFGLVLIVYDLFWLPMQVFDPPGSTFTEVMGWMSSVYWAVDIPMSLLVGHLSRGIIEMKVRVIARLYLRGWFWFDLTVVSVDWVLNIMEVVNNTKNVGGISALRLGKGVRVLRVFRLIRELLDTIHSEHCIIIVGIVKLLALILCVNHIIACLWFWVGSSEHAVNWISEAEILPRTIAYKCLGTDFFQRRRTERLPLMLGLI
eukprot:g2816.t1